MNIHSKYLEQGMAHSRCSENVNGMHEWIIQGPQQAHHTTFSFQFLPSVNHTAHSHQGFFQNTNTPVSLGCTNPLHPLPHTWPASWSPKRQRATVWYLQPILSPLSAWLFGNDCEIPHPTWCLLPSTKWMPYVTLFSWKTACIFISALTSLCYYLVSNWPLDYDLLKGR